VHGIKRDIDGLDTKKFAALSDAVTAQTQQRGEKGLRWILLACLIVLVSFLLTALAYRKIVRKF
jgi:hypothetical protein